MNSTQNDWAKSKTKLDALKELCIEEDLLDLQAYGDIERADKIQNAWDALRVIENIDTLLADARKDERMKAEVEMGLKNFKVTMEEISKARKEGYEEGVMAMAQDCEERNKGMFRGLSEGVYIKTGKELLATTNKSDHIVPPDKMVDTQNDTKKEDVLLQVANMDRIVREKWFIDWLKNHDKAILADARKEVGNGIEKMYLSVADKDPRYDTVEEIQAYNQAIYEILATLKEEGK